MKTVESTSDERTVNNVMRHEYRVLNEMEKHCMQEIKDRGLDFYTYLDLVAQRTTPGVPSSRELALAKTKIEEAVMWAVKHITR